MCLKIFDVPGVFRGVLGFTDTPTNLLGRIASEESFGQDETLRQTSHARTILSQIFV